MKKPKYCCATLLWAIWYQSFLIHSQKKQKRPNDTRVRLYKLFFSLETRSAVKNKLVVAGLLGEFYGPKFGRSATTVKLEARTEDNLRKETGLRFELEVEWIHSYLEREKFVV